MWLINTRTHKLEEFIGRDIPPYAILSHTWGKEEVSFQDMKDLSFLTWPGVISKAGFVKILNTCKLAHQRKLQYAWVDTCCIDKSSSAELTEAINSMFKWYQRAAICYAWLSDLDPSADIDSDFDGSGDLGQCRWFTRGWTLQELIAPKEVEFYDRDWNPVGCKSGLVDQLYAVTAIAIDVLRGDEGALLRTCVAEKMSWAAGRQTSRVEDATYCLMGIFGINMPLFYGEEEKAFQRLQNEILREEDDVTIFAWERALHRPRPDQSILDIGGILGGVLAESADDFAAHRNRGKIYPPPIKRPTLQVMKNCIKIRTDLVWEEVHGTGGRRYYVYCGSRGEDNVAIPLAKLSDGSFVRKGLHQCVSENHLNIDTLRRRDLSLLVNVSSYPIPLFLPDIWDLIKMRFRCPQNMKVAEVWPWSRWHDEELEFVTSPMHLCGSVLFDVYHTAQSTNLPIGQRTEIVFIFDCTHRKMKGALLERYGDFQTKVDHINSFLSSEEPDSFEFDKLLTQTGLPMSNRVVFDSGGSNRSIVSSFTSKKLELSAKESATWEVVFEIDECEKTSVQPVQYRKWQAGLF